jgi:hypothetical protein
MADILCPACGGELRFRSRVSVFTVCSYCSSMVVRHDLNLETLGKMAELPLDMSPLQVGTRGRYRNKAFELVGRLKIGWEDGTWNEWYALFDDGSDGWLAEAQGFYAMSFEVKDTRNVPPRRAIAPGRSVTFANEFEVTDIKEATCVGSEGELPFQGPKGRTSTSVDLIGSEGHFACIDYSDDGVRLYVGSYVEFDDLKLTSLREIDGW